MSSIAQQWTGKGLAAGTALVSGNVNTAGNGSNVSYGSTGTAEIITEGNGFRIRNTEDGSIRRLDTTTTGTGVRAQIVLTVGSAATGNLTITQLRNASTAVADVVVSTDNRIYIGGLAPTSPKFSFGDKLLVDVVHTLHPSPTTSNGRSFIRVRNLTNAAWNTNGEWFYDSGYSTNRGTTDFTQTRFGKISTNNLTSPGFLYEFMGWEAITVDTSHTTQAQATTYFADAPSESSPLPTPTGLVAAPTAPISSGGDGSVTVTWNRVQDASYYIVERALGNDATSGWVTVVANVPQSASPTISVVVPTPSGQWTFGVTAMPGA